MKKMRYLRFRQIRSFFHRRSDIPRSAEKRDAREEGHVSGQCCGGKHGMGIRCAGTEAHYSRKKEYRCGAYRRWIRRICIT